MLLAAVFLALHVLLILMASEWGETTIVNPLGEWLAKPSSWSADPFSALYDFGRKHSSLALLSTLGILGLGFILFAKLIGESLRSYAPAFLFIFLLAVLAYMLAAQEVVKAYNLSYALWALAVGLLLSNTIGTPSFARPGVKTEFYIKTGLVLLGAELLLGRLLALGLPGIFVAWVVTPIVLVTTFWFGQKILRIASPSLNMVVSADMSVCGVSAAIATAAACKAKKEELSFAIGLSLTFTVMMMVVLPAVIKALGISDVLGGAWIGGTIDATGAVAAAGAILGEEALQVAATVKMIQNILIGVIAFGVALYWTTVIERSSDSPTVGIGEIWRRFPKFVLGFVAASVVFSLIYASGTQGEEMVEAATKSTKTLRGWCFCLAFVSIGLETRFSEFGKYLHGGKPLILYIAGQSLNILLTLFMAWLMFEIVFPDATAALRQ